MKHLNKIHASVVAMEMAEPHQIAMEGFSDSIKAGWEAVKSKFSPTDHQALMSRLAALPQLRQGVIDAKKQISAGNDDGQFAKNIHRFTAHMPVSASSGDQLVKELGIYRKRIQALIQAAQNAKTPEDVKKYRQQMLVELSKRGNVDKNIVFTKKVILQVLDETIALLDVIAAAGGEYKKAYEAAEKPALEGFKGNVAMESYEDAFEIALESASNVIVGTLVLFAAIIGRVMMYFSYLMAIASLITGAFAAAAGFYLIGYGLQWVTQLGIEKATDMLVED